MAKSLYKLSCELHGHTGDVRGLAVAADGNIVSSSRDKTAILWKFEEEKCVGNVVMTGHLNFVSTVCVINPSQKHPKGFIITGSNDNHICIYNPGEKLPIHKIKAHENTVCAVRASHLEKNSFLTSSWDITGKLWNLDCLQEPQVIYLGHSAAVWCISDLPNGCVVTGSADKTVIVFSRDGKILHKLEGHVDCVRDITVVKENEFLTCANDAVIKYWSAITGDCLGNFYGHSNYIYSMSVLHGGNLVVSSGEDKTIRIWCNGEVDQTITLPAQSIWCVALLPNEDIACGASDGLIRIFTANPNRYADSETIQRFEESVESNADQLSDLNLKDLCDASVLHQPGKKDGETKLIKEDNAVIAYSWSQSQLKWNKIGDVVGANSNNSGKQLHNGIEYDYIFSVDIQDGVPPLKLPYNRGQDPWVIAQKFIDDNSLSQLYLEQVANFIIKNSTPAPVVNNASQFYDPFTGGNRYVPQSTTENITQPAQSPPVIKSSNTFDTTSYIPITTFLKLGRGNLVQIQEKLIEFNSKQEIGTQSIPEDKLVSVVKLATKDNHGAIEAGAINTLTSLLSWPDSFLFPVLDIARHAVLEKNVNDKFCSEQLLNFLTRHLKQDALASNQLLTFRLLANMFCHETGEELCLHYKNEVLKSIVDLPSLGNKNNQVAVSTYILNLVVALNKTNDSAAKTQILSVICSVLEQFKEVEALFRVLVTLATLLKAASASERVELVSTIRQSEKILNILCTISENSDSSTHNKLISVSKQITDLIF